MPEVHIASCVVHSRPEALERVMRAIRATGIADMPRKDERGRIILLIERPTTGEAMDLIDAVRWVDGVIAVHLAYATPQMEPVQ